MQENGKSDVAVLPCPVPFHPHGHGYAGSKVSRLEPNSAREFLRSITARLVKVTAEKM